MKTRYTESILRKIATSKNKVDNYRITNTWNEIDNKNVVA